MVLDKALFCKDCDKFLGWSIMDNDCQCSNCRASEKRIAKYKGGNMWELNRRKVRNE